MEQCTNPQLGNLVESYLDKTILPEQRDVVQQHIQQESCPVCHLRAMKGLVTNTIRDLNLANE